MPSRTTPILSIAVLFFSVAAHAADDPRAIVRQLYVSYAGGDLAAVRHLLADGPPPKPLTYFTAMHRTRCISLAELHVGEPRAAGDRVEVPVVASLAKVEAGTGRQTIDHEHTVVGMKRIDGQWKVDSWTFDEDKLVENLLKAQSEAEAEALLASSPELFDTSLARALRVRGTTMVNRQEYDQAARVAVWLHDLAALTADDEVLSTAYGLDSMLARMRKNPDTAASEHLAEESLAAAKRTENPDTIGTALMFLIRAYQWRDGNTKRGAPVLEQVLALRSRYADESVAQRAAIQLAGYQLERGQYRRAIPYIAIGKEIANATNDTLGLYSVELMQARFFHSFYDCGMALPYYRRARDLADKAHFIGYFPMQQGVAHCAMLLGRDEEFRAAAEDLLKRHDTIDLASLSALWGDIAADHLRRGELDEAEQATDEAMQIAGKAVEDECKVFARSMMARVRFAQKRYAESLQAAEDAIAYQTKIGTVSQDSAWVLAARAHLALGQRDAAYESLRTAVRYGETERATAGGTERQLALLFEPAAEAYSMLVDLMVEDHQAAEALLIAEKAKARTLLDVLADVRSTEEADAPPASVGEERKREQQLVDANAKGDRAAIAKARLELETYRAMVDANRPRLHAARGAGVLQSAESLEPILPDDRSAIVEYVATEKRLHVFIVRRGTEGPRVDVRSVPIARKELERLAGSYAAALSSHDLSYAADARKLHEILLAPVVRAAPQTRHLCIIPDGALWRVPFESLIDEHGAFAIERRAFFYAPSATVLLRERARKPAADTTDHVFFGMGDPLLEEPAGEIGAETERAVSRAPIPEAAREVRTIARIIGPRSSSVFTGPDALESRAKTDASQYRIVHLATHGVLDDANPMYSRLLLSRRDGDGEDGVLEAREMLDLHLGADLVVLSACDTARGDIHRGEGLIGMSWALFAAGAPSVIASEWRVGSARTENLMTAFYRKWMERRNAPFAKAEALRAARLELLRDPDYRHPYYWSPFVLIGSAD